MKIREKDDHDEIGFANERSPTDVFEVIVHFSFYEGSEPVDKYEFYVEALGKWLPGEEVFDWKNKHIITNKYNTHFLEPKTEEDRQRGYEI